MFKGSAFAFYIILIMTVLPVICHVTQASLAYTNESVLEVQNVLFAFGWSANAGEKWIVNGETFMLNSKALVVPSSDPIETDAGPLQENPYMVYLNNMGFNHGWSSNPTERYRPSDSMTVGALSAFNSKGLITPPTTPISEDAGPKQANPSHIYFNNIGFHYTWSPNAADMYRPSTSMSVGALSAFNSNGLVSPPTIPMEDDAGPAQEYLSLIYLNNVGFHYGWSLYSEDRYSPSPTMAIGPLTPLNTNGLKKPPAEATEEGPVDSTPPYIGTPTQNPPSNVVNPGQEVTVSVNVIDTESGVHNAILSYSTDNRTSWTNVTMSYIVNNLYQVTIPGQLNSTWVTYKIIAYDNAGNCAVKDNAGEYFTYHVFAELPTLTVTVTLNPTVVNAGQSISVKVHVANGTVAIEDALLQLASDKGGTFAPQMGYTDVHGDFTATFTTPTLTEQTNVRITATASKSSFKDNSDYEYVTVFPAGVTLPTLSVSVAANPTTIQSGQTSTITTRVTYGGSPVSGVTVTLSSDNEGTFTQTNGNTDSDGYFTPTFTAPTVTTQTTITITANATKTGYLDGQSQTQITVNPSQPPPPPSQPDQTLWIYLAILVVTLLAIGGGIAMARRKIHKPKEEVISRL